MPHLRGNIIGEVGSVQRQTTFTTKITDQSLLEEYETTIMRRVIRRRNFHLVMELRITSDHMVSFLLYIYVTCDYSLYGNEQGNVPKDTPLAGMCNEFCIKVVLCVILFQYFSLMLGKCIRKNVSVFMISTSGKQWATEDIYVHCAVAQ